MSANINFCSVCYREYSHHVFIPIRQNHSEFSWQSSWINCWFVHFILTNARVHLMYQLSGRLGKCRTEHAWLSDEQAPGKNRWRRLANFTQNFKPPVWKTGSTSSICIGCSNNNTAANSRLSTWEFNSQLKLPDRSAVWFHPITMSDINVVLPLQCVLFPDESQTDKLIWDSTHSLHTNLCILVS